MYLGIYSNKNIVMYGSCLNKTRCGQKTQYRQSFYFQETLKFSIRLIFYLEKYLVMEQTEPRYRFCRHTNSFERVLELHANKWQRVTLSSAHKLSSNVHAHQPTASVHDRLHTQTSGIFFYCLTFSIQRKHCRC